MNPLLLADFTIKRINKGLKPVVGQRFGCYDFTIKRINKGLKPSMQ